MVLRYFATQGRFDTIVKIYFAVIAVLAISELFELKNLILFFKPILIPVLALMYFSQGSKKCVYYIMALLFAWASNIFFLFEAKEFLFYGITSFMVYRLLSIIVVLRLVKNFVFLPFLVAMLPFVFIFSCLINITVSFDSPEFYPTVINGALISVLAGIALSNYIMNDNKRNSWLAISTLLFITLVSIFLIEKYYISNVMFQPISALVFGFAHYTFYKFVIESEKPELKSDTY